MFNFFRINDPYRLIFVFVLLLIVRSIFWIIGIPLSQLEFKFLLIGERLGDGFIMYKDAYDYTSPLSVFVYKWIDIIFGRSRGIHHFISTLLIFTNAAILNFLLIRNRAYTENNYLPGLFYVLFSFAIPDFFALSPQLMSSTFILLALNNVFMRVDNQASDELFLFAGLFLGVAILFYLPSLVFFLLFLIALMIFSTAILRRLLLFLYGLIIPPLIAFGYFYWFDGATYFIDAFIGRGLFSDRIFYISKSFFWLIVVLPGTWFVISAVQTFARVKLGIYESKILQIMILFGLAGVACILIDVEFSANQLVLFLPFLSYFMTHYALNLKRRVFKSLMPVLIVISLLSAPFYFNFEIEDISIVNSKQLGFSDKKLMILDDNLDSYLNQNIASPFIDPKLSKDNMRLLDNYKTASELYNTLAQNPPEIIIDNWGVMDKIFYRFPLFEKRYRTGTNNRYYLKDTLKPNN